MTDTLLLLAVLALVFVGGIRTTGPQVPASDFDRHVDDALAIGDDERDER